jgi:hypothetical protein
MLDLPLLLLGDGAVHGAAVAAGTVPLLSLLACKCIYGALANTQVHATVAARSNCFRRGGGTVSRRESQQKKLVRYTFS